MQYAHQTVYRLINFDVCRVDLDAHTLPDQVHRQNEARVRSLSNEASYDALEGAVRHFDHHPFVYQGAWVVLQLTFKEPPNAFDFVIGNRRGLSFNRHDIDDACAFQNGQRLLFFETGEAIARKERPVDLLLSILPAAPAGDSGQKRVEFPALDLLAHNMLVTRARPDSEPTGRHSALESRFSRDAD